jgi:hypothetical protein
MEAGQRRRLKKLVDDYRGSGIFLPHQITAGVLELARRLKNPHVITRDELNQFLRDEDLPQV